MFLLSSLLTQKKKKEKKILKTDLNIGEKKKKIFILRYGLGAYTCTHTFSFFCKIPKLFNWNIGSKSLTKAIILLGKKTQNKT